MTANNDWLAFILAAWAFLCIMALGAATLLWPRKPRRRPHVRKGE